MTIRAAQASTEVDEVHRYRPVIGISCSAKTSHANRAYVEAIELAGGAPLLIPPLGDKASWRTMYERSDALLLPGGGDINPEHYGEKELCKVRNRNDLRDDLELALARWALQDGIPILAICRGLQVLNVALGGTLYQDIGSQLPRAREHDWRDHPRDFLAHKIEIEPQTYLAEIFEASHIDVNSRHHQAVKEVAPELSVSAKAPDEIIEALEAPGPGFVLAVQFHPENLVRNDQRMQRLFGSFVEAASAPRAML